MDTPELELVSYILCPYVQRSVITLLHKKAEFWTTYIDLARPPDWFRELSPLGKVPLLLVREPGSEAPAVLFESAVINEYIDEVTPPSLQSSDPLERARERAWVEASGDLLLRLHQAMMSPDLSESQAAVNGLWPIIERVEQELPGGGLFRGDLFSLVDAAFAPFFMRFFLIDPLRESKHWARLPRTRKWAENLLITPEVLGSVPSDFPERYLQNLRGRGNDYARNVA